MIIETLEELYRIFDMLNKKYYNSELDRPIITIQKSRPSNLGHFTLSKIWENKETKDARYEININPINLDRPTDEIIETLHHEMVHYYNKVRDIKDCNGQIHNKKFKSEAERVGLIVEKSKKYGYGVTSASESFVSFIKEEIKPIEGKFEYFMNLKKDIEPTKEKVKRTFKYTCPVCGMEVKAKPELNIMCGECSVQLEIEED